MFEDVGNAGRIGRWGAEVDAKDLVFVVVDQRDDFAAGAVPVEQGAGIELGNFFVAQQFKIAAIHCVSFVV